MSNDIEHTIREAMGYPPGTDGAYNTPTINELAAGLAAASRPLMERIEAKEEIAASNIRLFTSLQQVLSCLLQDMSSMQKPELPAGWRATRWDGKRGWVDQLRSGLFEAVPFDEVLRSQYATLAEAIAAVERARTG